MQKYTIKTLKDTEKLADKIAGSLRGGEVIGLIGNLGAGKTTFVQYLAKALGVKETVNSPTFNIIKEYKILNTKYKIQKLIHIDAYRLNSPDELLALGWGEFVDIVQSATIIEWADKIKSILPPDAIIINMQLKKDGSRLVSVIPAKSEI